MNISNEHKKWALVAELEAIKAEIEGKKIANLIRHINYESPAYSEDSFIADATSLMEISQKFSELSE